jgi:hypothetical protein
LFKSYTLSVSFCLLFFIYLFVCLFIYVFILLISLFLYLFMFLIYLFILLIYLFIFLIYLFCLFIYFACLFIYLFLFLIYLFILLMFLCCLCSWFYGYCVRMIKIKNRMIIIIIIIIFIIIIIIIPPSLFHTPQQFSRFSKDYSTLTHQTLLIHCFAKNFPTMRHALIITAFCTWIYRAGRSLCSFKLSRYLFGSLLLTKCYSDDQIEKNEMGGACSTYRGEKRCIQGFGGETWRKETTWEIQA